MIKILVTRGGAQIVIQKIFSYHLEWWFRGKKPSIPHLAGLRLGV